MWLTDAAHTPMEGHLSLCKQTPCIGWQDHALHLLAVRGAINLLDDVLEVLVLELESDVL